MIEILAYTDGSAVVNGPKKGCGGFGTYFPNLFGKKAAYSLGFRRAKTGQMEVTALLQAIMAMPKTYHSPIRLVVYSDSEYVVKTFTEKRLEKWISTGRIYTEIANSELWLEIREELLKRRYMELKMIHIRSHQVEKEKDKNKKAQLLKNKHIIGNMVADRLADYKRHKKLL